MDRAREEVEFYLTDASAIGIAYDVSLFMKRHLKLIDEFVLWEHVSIAHIDTTPPREYFAQHEFARDVLAADPQRLEDITPVLEELKRRYPGTDAESHGNITSIAFKQRDHYEAFCTASKEQARGDYVFEGDVLDLLRPAFVSDNFVLLKLSTSFDVAQTLAKLMR